MAKSRKGKKKSSAKPAETLAEHLKEDHVSRVSEGKCKPNSDPTILLHSRIPPPLWYFNPRTILGASWWTKEKKKAKQRCRDFCEACGVHKNEAKGKTKWLEGHEQYDIDFEKGVVTYKGTVMLCHYCHNFIHDGLMRVLVKQNRMRYNKYAAIIQYGEEVLERIGKTRDDTLQLPPESTWPEESEWILVINGNTYYRKDYK